VGGGWEGKGGGDERRGRLHGLCALRCVYGVGWAMGRWLLEQNWIMVCLFLSDYATNLHCNNTGKNIHNGADMKRWSLMGPKRCRGLLSRRLVWRSDLTQRARVAICKFPNCK